MHDFPLISLTPTPGGAVIDGWKHVDQNQSSAVKGENGQLEITALRNGEINVDGGAGA